MAVSGDGFFHDGEEGDPQKQQYLPLAAIFLIGASRLFFTGRFRTRENAEYALKARLCGDVLVAALCRRFFLSHPSIVPYWDPLTRFFSRWHTRILPSHDEKDPKHPHSFSAREAFLNGPLGLGAAKIVHVVVAIILWRLLKKEWPPLKFFGDEYPGIWELGVLAGICGIVNGVLYAWSRITKSRGKHDGVHRMVASSTQRKSLTRNETLLFGCLAFANAACEEITFRWFWNAEFAVYLPRDTTKHANLCQAILFGALHYYGIPSGFAGVGLTFCYGWIMGLLKNLVGGGGLFLPIVAHTIADYYLFSSIARGKAVGNK